MKLTFVIFGLMLLVAACSADPEEAEWQETEIVLPDEMAEVTYMRRAVQNAWVGTEQERQLRVANVGVATLPVQIGGRDTVDVYLLHDSLSDRLYFKGFEMTAAVDLQTLEVSEQQLEPASQPVFIGIIASPQIRDLRFIPASEASPAYETR